VRETPPEAPSEVELPRLGPGDADAPGESGESDDSDASDEEGERDEARARGRSLDLAG